MTVNTVVSSGLKWLADFEAWLAVGYGVKKRHKNGQRHLAKSISKRGVLEIY